MASPPASSSAGGSRYSSPCAACKFLRRKCLAGCIFAPYFAPEETHKFANLHKIFGASNVAKLLKGVPPQLREDAVDSLTYEAEARVRDPVYGCVADITFLRGLVDRLQNNLQLANARLIHYSNYGMPSPITTHHTHPNNPSPPSPAADQSHHHIHDDFPYISYSPALQPWDHHHHRNN